MGRILNRYFFGEILVPFLFGIAVFTSVLLIARILKLVEMVVNRGVPLLEMLKLFSLILPAFLEVTVPMALLLAILMAFGRLSTDSEIVAVKTSGVSLYQMLSPVAAFTALAFALALVMALFVRPWANGALRAQLFEIAKNRATAGFREKVFNDAFPGLVIYAEEIETGGTTLKGILIADARDPKLRSTWVAKVGFLLPNESTKTVTLRLLDGTMYGSSGENGSLNKTNFTVYDVSLNLTALTDMRLREKDPKEMTLGELRARIAAERTRGRGAVEERLEFNRKLSIPFACLVFALVGMPLGIQSSRAVRSRGFAVSLVLIFFYYAFLTVGQTLAERGYLPPVLALWIPNAAFLAGGAHLFARAAREAPLPALETIELFWQRARLRVAAHLEARGTS